MSKSLSLIFLAAVSFCCLNFQSQASADFVDFVFDSTQSFADVTLSGVGPERSQTSGSGRLFLTPSLPPFGVAQIQEMAITLDDGLSFSLLGGAVTATTTAGNVLVDLETPGPAGNVNGSQFDQLNNVMGVAGLVNVSDPFNLVGGDATLDLSTLNSDPVNFTGVTLSRVGDIVTLSGNYTVTQNIDIGGNSSPLIMTGSFVASGVAVVPEPGTTSLLVAASMLLISRRRRISVIPG